MCEMPTAMLQMTTMPRRRTCRHGTPFIQNFTPSCVKHVFEGAAANLLKTNWKQKKRKNTHKQTKKRTTFFFFYFFWNWLRWQQSLLRVFSWSRRSCFVWRRAKRQCSQLHVQNSRQSSVYFWSALVVLLSSLYLFHYCLLSRWVTFFCCCYCFLCVLPVDLVVGWIVRCFLLELLVWFVVSDGATRHRHEAFTDVTVSFSSWPTEFI